VCPPVCDSCCIPIAGCEKRVFHRLPILCITWNGGRFGCKSATRIRTERLTRKFGLVCLQT
jgi:hypothetical protein